VRRFSSPATAEREGSFEGQMLPERKDYRMKRYISLLAFTALLAGCGDDKTTDSSNASPTSFFVTSTKSATGNLGGLRGADSRCQGLAAAAGLGAKTWRAYLSVERDPDNGNQPTDARTRIGNGPWVNANGMTVANNNTELHARKGDAAVFVDERGQRIPGQWPGSPSPVEHDILTGSTPEGTVLAGMTCNDWTSDSSTVAAQVGHSDGLGPNANPAGNFASWNSSHASASCADTAPRGGAGRLYCFAAK
jgi:hypothetical protein